MRTSVLLKNQNRWTLLVWLTCLALCLAVTACSAPQLKISACKSRDWYETGRRDGAVGKPTSALDVYRKECSTTPDSDLYLNGRNAGLVEYCTPQSGLEAGRTGERYAAVCPEHLEKKFLSSFHAGEEIRSLEKENSKLEAEIESLARAPASDASSGSMTGNGATGGADGAANSASNTAADRVENLRKLRSANQAAIQSLESQNL